MSAAITSSEAQSASTENNNLLLLSLLQSAIPTIVECTILDTIVQANAQGCRVTATHSPLVIGKQELFVKQIQAADYLSKKSSWNDLRRTLLYGRTEVRFYKEIQPLLLCKGFPSNMIPTCHVAECNFNTNGLISDDAVAYEDDNHHVTTMPSMEQAAHHGAFLVLDSMDMTEYYQTSPLTKQEALKCLETVAHLHAAAWQQDKDVLQHANTRMARGSYHLSTRNPKELQDMQESWKHFCHEFQHMQLFSQTSIQALGRRMQHMAEYISQQLTPSPTDPYATLTHGDYKAMNVFLPVDNEKSAVMIDFASTGVGNPMSDVAMHVIHAVQPSNGDDDENALVDGYLTMLEQARTKYHHDASPYPREVALRHYRLACCDYIRFIMGRFWKSATVASFEQKKNSMNVTLVNRNVNAAMAWIQKVDTYLQEFEDEKAAMTDKNLI